MKIVDDDINTCAQENLMNRYISILFVFLYTFFLSCNVQRESTNARNKTINKIYSLKDVEKIVLKIEKGKIVESSNIGDGGQISFQYLLYNQLAKNASLTELTNLLNHKSPAVRCYSFQALVNNKSDSIIPLFISHLNDTIVVQTLSGCIGSTVTVRDYYWSLLSPNFNKYILSLEQRNLIYSVITFK